MKVTVEVSLGELVDKLTILEIKSEKILDKQKIENVDHERKYLTHCLEKLNLENIDLFFKRLKEINLKLWDIEDDIRECERRNDFTQEFITLARSVYKVNDQRFLVKSEINQKFGSELNEVKSYKEY